MNHLNSAREHITSAFQATGENQMRSLRCAQVHAQIASAEAQTRIAECLEAPVGAQTPDAGEATKKQGGDLNMNQLYDRERIERIVDYAIEQSKVPDALERHQAIALMLVVRDEYQRRFEIVGSAINQLEMMLEGLPSDVYMDMGDIVESMRSCTDTNAMPDPLADLAPDWSQAPEWAQWWAVDDDGGCHWYADRPRPTDTQWLPPRLPSRYSTAGEIAWTMADWRQCIWQRPQAQEATRPDWLPEWRGG